MIDVDVFPSDTSWLSEPTTGVHQFGGGSSTTFWVVGSFVGQEDDLLGPAPIGRTDFRRSFSMCGLALASSAASLRCLCDLVLQVTSFMITAELAQRRFVQLKEN